MLRINICKPSPANTFPLPLSLSEYGSVNRAKESSNFSYIFHFFYILLAKFHTYSKRSKDPASILG